MNESKHSEKILIEDTNNYDSGKNTLIKSLTEDLELKQSELARLKEMLSNNLSNGIEDQKVLNKVRLSDINSFLENSCGSFIIG